MHRFFLDEIINENKVFIKEQSDINHIKNVLRIKENEKIEIVDKDYNEYIATIDFNFESSEKILLNIVKQIDVKRESDINLCLFAALLKSDKFEGMISQATQIGVNEIYPLITNRTIVKVKDSKKKVDRYNRIVSEVSKQCKRIKIPVVNDILNLKTIIKEDKYNEIFNDFDLIILCYELENKKDINSAIYEFIRENNVEDIYELKRKKELKVGVVIGPEGGFEDEEVKYLLREKTKVVTLGNRILKAETASLLILSILQHRLGDIC